MRGLKAEKMLELSITLLYLLSGTALASSHPVWQYNNPQYASAPYDKILGIAHNINNPSQERLGPFQYRYVDYQPSCKSGGQPVCATNGTNYFYFENDCKLEAANMKMIFQHGTELERTELEHCLPQCDGIRCNKVYAPVCAVAEKASNKVRGVTYANECEAQKHGCTIKQTMRILNKGPCKQKSRTKSKSNSKRKQGKKRRSRSTTPATSNKKKRKHFRVASKPSSFKTRPVSTTTTTTTSTPEPMQFHQYREFGNPGVSVSRAVNAYSVYNIPHVGYNYDEILDSSLSLYVPGVGTVTDTPPSTTTTKQRPTAAIPTGFTLAPSIGNAVPQQEYTFFLIPYGTTSTTTTESIIGSALKSEVNSTSSTVANILDTIAGTTGGTTVGSTAGTTVATTLRIPKVVRNETVLETTTETKPKPQPASVKTHLSISEAILKLK